MVYVFLIVSLSVFVLGVRALEIVERAGATTRDAREAVDVLASKDIDEDHKERIIRATSIRMFVAFLTISARFIACLALSALVVYAGTIAGLFTAAGAVDAASHPAFVAVATLATVGALFYPR